MLVFESSPQKREREREIKTYIANKFSKFFYCPFEACASLTLVTRKLSNTNWWANNF